MDFFLKDKFHEYVYFITRLDGGISPWNFLVKKNDDKALAIIAICLGHLPFCIIGLLYTGLPPFSSLGFILLSGVFHTGYLIFLMHTYRFGDLSAVYPIARGFLHCCL